jgi:DNA-binding response OmpR family regulator
MSSPTQPWRVLVYSQDAKVRERNRGAVGRRPATDIGRIEYAEASTDEEVLALVDAGGIDLCILDGEAWPAGGLGLSRQLKHEIKHCPRMVVVLGRQADRWLATWSQCDGVLVHPLDPVDAARTVAGLLRGATPQPAGGRPAGR